MSRTGQWFFELQQKHYDKKCEKPCQFCEEEKIYGPHGNPGPCYDYES